MAKTGHKNCIIKTYDKENTPYRKKNPAFPKHRLTDILPFTESPSRNRYRNNASEK